MITSDEKNDKDFHYLNTESSSNEESDREARRRSEALQLVRVINTTELIAHSQALQLHPHSPSSFRSTQDYFGEDSKSLPFQPKKQLEYGTSPIQPGAIPIPQTNPRTSNSSFGTSPRPSSTRLEPDEHGNEIPSDAKWTKINRRLVSPEVLDQDRRRYEARPEFVAVLGVLSRAEIEGLAERSRIIRDARFRRSLPVQAPQQAPPPRPIPVPIPHVSSRHRSGRDTPSSSSDSESDESGRDGTRRKSKGRRGYAGSNVGAPVSGYPNPFGQPLPSPVRSPGGREGSGTWISSGGSYNEKDRSRERERERDRERDSSSHKDHVRDRDREERRDRDRDGSRKRHSSNGSRAKGSDRRDRERDSREKYQKSNRWKENLTAAGIGGAAVSLLNVLTEAAEGL